MQELCWACETMTRQTQWEVCTLNAVPAPPLPNKESRLSPALLSSHSASHTQLWRPVGACTLPCVLGKKARRVAHSHSRPQQIAKSYSNPSSFQMEGGEIGKREAEGYFKAPMGLEGGHLWAELQLVTKPPPLNASRTLTWVPLLPHDKLRWCYKMRHNVTPWSASQLWQQNVPSKEMNTTGSSSRGDTDIFGKRRKPT